MRRALYAVLACAALGWFAASLQPTAAHAQDRARKHAPAGNKHARKSGKRKAAKASPPSAAAPAKSESAAVHPPPTAANAAESEADVHKEGNTEVKTVEFSGLDIEGQLKTPQMLYFLNRLRAEFDRPELPHRSFMPELSRSTKEKDF